jgi:dihydrofolate reductase
LRKLIYSMGVSLDGFIAGPDGEIDWSAPDEELHRFHNRQARETGAHLYGRRLYEAMIPWETADEQPSASTLMKLGFIDEYRLFVSPVVLGGATPYFPALDERINLEFVEARTFGSRVVYVRYQRVEE